jgi:myo-inositol-1(or 4)-monophosphatase
LDRSELLATALAAARDAAEIHRAHLGRVRTTDWSEKGAADFVTFVDREAESAIVARIHDRFPDHELLAEEAASERGPASGVLPEAGGEGWIWIIDPLDGTTNYLHGYPSYAASIGVVHAGVVQAAVVLNSASADEWTAVRGGGAYRNGERVHVSEIERMPQALVGTGFPFKALHLLPLYLRQFDRVLRNSSGVRRAGSAALDLAHVATGWFDGFWEMSLAPWDVAAGTLLVQEAGGRVTRLDGHGSVLGHGAVLAGNPTIHAALGEILAHVTIDGTP